MWVIAVAINGLMLVSLEPFHSQEACYLAAKELHVGECVEIATPEDGTQ